MVPRRVFDAFQRGELDLFDFAIVVFLIGAVDRRTLVAKFTLAGLADGLGWQATAKTSTDWLRKRLLRLRRDEWIEFESKPGQPEYVIRLSGAAVEEATSDSARTALGLRSDSARTGDLGLDLGLDPSPDNGDLPSEAGSIAPATSDSTSDLARAREDVDEDVDEDSRLRNSLPSVESSSGSRDGARARPSPAHVDGPLASSVGDQIARLAALSQKQENLNEGST